MNDFYELTLLYLKELSYEELNHIMDETADHFLSQKIKKFLHAMRYEKNLEKVKEQHDALFHYLEHVFCISVTRLLPSSPDPFEEFSSF